MSINIGDLLGSLTGGGNNNAGNTQSSASGGGGGSANLMQSLLPALLPMLANGGLTKILGGLQAKGLTEQVDSWESDDANEPVSAAQIKDALGDQELNNVAQKAGVSTDQAASAISQLLPQLVDKVTPNGKLPDQNSLSSLLGSLNSQLGK